MVVNMKNSKILIITSWTAVILCMLVIFCFSAQNADQSSGTSGGFAKFLAKILYRYFNTIDKPSQDILINKCQFIVRKTAHFTVYATLGILTYMAVRISKFKFSYLISSVICLAYAVSDEIHQYFVPGRSCELRDVFIDFSGSVLGIILIAIILIFLRNIKTKN